MVEAKVELREIAAWGKGIEAVHARIAGRAKPDLLRQRVLHRLAA